VNRRSFVGTLGLGLLATPLAAEAQQQAGKVPRIGFLGLSRPELVRPALEGFRQGLRERGWIEGQNIIIEYRWAEGNYDRLADLAAELVRLKVDVIVGATQAALAAKNATKTIPIVMTTPDPVGSGLIRSLARPGGNITGVGNLGVDIIGKQLELLKEVVPEASRVAVLVNPTHSAAPLVVKEAEAAARSLRVRLQILEVRDSSELNSAFAAMTRERAEALLVQGDAMFLAQRDRIAELAAKRRLLAMYSFREHVQAGGLIGYGANLSDLFRRLAFYVDKILKGAKPGDLPFEQATKFDLVINLKTAKALSLTIPQSLLQRADEVIQY